MAIGAGCIRRTNYCTAPQCGYRIESAGSAHRRFTFVDESLAPQQFRRFFFYASVEL
jgi:hypothetical protein